MTMLQSCLKFFHSVVRILWPPVLYYHMVKMTSQVQKIKSGCISLNIARRVKFQCSTSNIKGDTATFYFLHLTRHFDHVIVYFNIVAFLFFALD